jgi:hypothetical protein
MLLTHARVKHLSFPTARYFSTAARAPPRVRERAWRQAWGRWPAADVGRRARARPAWHDDVEGLLCFWWCACRRTTGVSSPLSRRPGTGRQRERGTYEKTRRRFPVRRSSYTVQRGQSTPPACVRAQRSPERPRAVTGVVLLSCGMCGRGTRWRWADTPGTLSTFLHPSGTIDVIDDLWKS